MKAIQVASEEELDRLLEDISIEAARAFDPWSLLKGLDAAIDQHVREFNNSRAFWRVTFNALHATVLSHLGRLYDKKNGSLSLGSFLQTVKLRSAYFSEQAIRRRLRRNPHAGLDRRPLDISALEAEVLSVSEKDPAVRHLHQIRNKEIAHRDGDMVRLATLSSLARLSVSDTDVLLNRASQITVKYSLLYRASSISRQLVGADDYKILLKLVKQGVDYQLHERLDQKPKVEQGVPQS